jgi:hypothetical protein
MTVAGNARLRAENATLRAQVVRLQEQLAAVVGVLASHSAAARG